MGRVADPDEVGAPSPARPVDRGAGLEGAPFINCDEQEQFMGRVADPDEVGAPSPARPV